MAALDELGAPYVKFTAGGSTGEISFNMEVPRGDIAIDEPALLAAVQNYLQTVQGVSWVRMEKTEVTTTLIQGGQA